MKLYFLYIPIFLLSALAVYGPAISADYGFRDDYSLTRETHEEPGKSLVFTASHGRPLYGVFVELSYRHVRSIADLAWLRLFSALLITAFCLGLFGQLQENGWKKPEAAAVAFLVLYLPASQVTISWAVGWPWGISLLFTVFGFRLAEEAWSKEGASRWWLTMCAIIFYTLSTAIYQSHTLLAVVLLASLLLSPAKIMSGAHAIKRSCFHLLIIFSGLAASYALLKIIFAAGIFQASARLQFETDLYSKLVWFLSQSLPNAIAFLTLRDDFNRGVFLFWSFFCIVIVLIFLALYKQLRNKTAMNWLLCICLLPWIAHSISLVAAERVLGYRTTYALSALVVVLLIAAIRDLFPGKLRYLAFSLLVSLAAILAYQQSYQLIAKPQAREWAMVTAAVYRMHPGVKTRIYLVEPKPADRSTARVFRDEFGSFSTNSSWAPDEMFKQAMHERFPNGIPKRWHYVFRHGGELPAAGDHYDQIIDMRQLRQWR